jgi:hypothetical protein
MLGKIGGLLLCMGVTLFIFSLLPEKECLQILILKISVLFLGIGFLLGSIYVFFYDK